MTEDLPNDSLERVQRVTKLLATQRTLPAKLEAVVAIVERCVPSCHAAGIMLLIDAEPTSVAVSDRLAVEIELVQYRTGEGPCLAAISTSNVVRIEVLERDSRFTRFAPGALDHQIQSILSIPLFAADRVVGALNLYSQLPNAFDAETEATAKPMADYAAEAIGTSPLYASALDMVEGLVETMEQRAVVNQASGVLMASEHCTAEQSMAQLDRLATSSGEPVHVVARWILEERPGRQGEAEAGLPRPGDP